MSSEPKPKYLVEIMRAKLVRPVDGTWDDLGTILRALRAPLHRAMNLTLTDLELEHREDKLGKKQDGKTPAQSRVYTLMRDHWAAERAAAEERVQSGKPIRGDEAVARFAPSSGMVLGVSGTVWSRWKKWSDKKNRWAGTSSLPTFRGEQPLRIASSSGNVALRAENGLPVLTVPLVSGQGKIDLVIEPFGPSEFAKVTRILQGRGVLGDCQIVESHRDDRDKRVWTVLLAHKFLPAEVPKGRTMALHRGMNSFLTAAIAAEEKKDAITTTLALGTDIREHKRSYFVRRRDLSKHGRELGAGAKGHGIDRRHQRVTRVADAEARWVKTKCQQIAMSAIKLAQRKGVSRILLDDWANPIAGTKGPRAFLEQEVGGFPMGQLRESIEWVAKKNGMTVDIVAGAYESRDCPACGHRHEEPPLRRDRGGKLTVFFCANPACRLERNVDQIAAWNLLVRDGHPSPHIDAAKALKRAKKRFEKAVMAAVLP